MSNFAVTEIVSEERDKIYRLYGISDKEWKKRKTKDKYLSHDGVKQTYCRYDESGERQETKIFDLTDGEVPYTVGYIGRCVTS